MITKFRTGSVVGSLIQEVQVERETTTSVWIKGRRNNKRSSHINYWDT